MRAVVGLTLALAAAPTLAAPCPAGPPPALPAPFESWQQATPLSSTVDLAAADSAKLELGRAVDVALRPSAGLRYAIAPGRAVKPGSHGGLASFDVPAAGRYRFAMGSFAWVDVVEDGKSLKSLARDHALPCVSKVLDFDLKAGRHIVQFADAEEAVSRLLIVRAP